MAKECVLYDRMCIGCGECDYCDINPMKLCDNCGKCLETGKDYNEIKIDRVILPDPGYENPGHRHGTDCGCD